MNDKPNVLCMSEKDHSEPSGERLGWSQPQTVQYQNIKSQLRSQAWVAARCITKNEPLVMDEEESLVIPSITIVIDWKESHFRAFLKHLTYDDTRAMMRAQEVKNRMVKKTPTLQHAQQYATDNALCRKVKLLASDAARSVVSGRFATDRFVSLSSKVLVGWQPGFFTFLPGAGGGLCWFAPSTDHHGSLE